MDLARQMQAVKESWLLRAREYERRGIMKGMMQLAIARMDARRSVRLRALDREQHIESIRPGKMKKHQTGSRKN